MFPASIETLQLLALNISSVSESVIPSGYTQNEKERPSTAAESRSAIPADVVPVICKLIIKRFKWGIIFKLTNMY